MSDDDILTFIEKCDDSTLNKINEKIEERIFLKWKANSEFSTHSINVNSLSGYIDIDRSNLPTLNDLEKIQYFEKRICNTVLNPIRYVFEHTKLIYGIPNTSIILIIGVSICQAIEAMGKFYLGHTGGGNNGTRFKDFICIYMNKYDGIKDKLWKDFRNGIAHAFSVKNGGFSGLESAIFDPSSNQVDPRSFFNNFEKAAKKYILDLKKEEEQKRKGIEGVLIKKFLKVFEAVYIKNT